MKPQAQLAINQFKQRDLTHNYHLHMDLEKKIREAATPAVSLMLGKWKLIDVRKDGDNLTVRVMINEKGQSMQSLSRRPNGTLQFKKQEKPQDSTPNFSGSTGWENELEHWTQEEILKIAGKIMGPNALRQEILNPNASLQSFIKQLAANIIEKAIIPMTDQDVQAWPVPAQQEDITYQNLRRNANEITRKRIVNPKIRTLANHLFNPAKISGRTTTSCYNTTALNTAIFTELLQTSPNVLRYYCNNIATRHRKPIRLKHPGQIIEAVRDEVKLPPAEWKYFCRVTTGRAEYQEKQKYLDTIRKAMTFLAEINQPDATDRQLQRVMWISGRYNPTDTKMCKATIQLTNRYLEHFKNTEHDNDNDINQLDRTLDALQSHIETGIPWGIGDWDTLEKRSEKWHQQIQQERNNKHDREIREAVWTSLIPTTTIDRYQFEPITNAQDLIRISSRMNNCLRSYWPRCLKGDNRIFIARQSRNTPQEPQTDNHPEFEIVAAVELRMEGRTWQVGQIEGPRRRAFPAGVKKATEKLRKMYEEAQHRVETTPATKQSPDHATMGAA